MTTDTPHHGSANPDRWLVLYLRVVGMITLLAFAAAIMPEDWIVGIAAWLGFEPFPHSPLTFYLARNLSTLYGFLGAGLLIVLGDLDRYRPLIRYLAWGTMAFGVLQGIVNAQAAMPYWWTLGESLSTFTGGVIIWWLDQSAQSQRET
ncbi:MAG: hypothetical protein MI861_13045 [Pirellulales bacterium]|nr:hypothetical protein [Pirellulales bacterium]